MKAYTVDDNAPLSAFLQNYGYIFRRSPALWLANYSQDEIDAAMSALDWRLDVAPPVAADPGTARNRYRHFERRVGDASMNGVGRHRS